MPKGIFDRSKWSLEHSKKMSGKNHPNYKDGRTLFKKKCLKCGNELKSYKATVCIKCVNVGRVPTAKARENMSNSHYQVGEKHWNWQGGISGKGYPKTWRSDLKDKVRRRDGFKCVLCGISQKEIGRKLDVHHINYLKDCLFYNNLVSLCNKCHGKTGSKNKSFWERFFYYSKRSYAWDKL